MVRAFPTAIGPGGDRRVHDVIGDRARHLGDDVG
jgi:hypothetical protein